MSESRPVGDLVVIAEDYPDISQLVGDLLRGEGYDVAAVANGREVLDTVLLHQPCILLLDLSLPDMPGNEVIQQLQLHPKTSRVPIVVVSAYTEHLHRVPQVRAVVNKPFDISTLLDAVAEARRALNEQV